MSAPFQGTINVDIRDSEPDWAPFEPRALLRVRRTSSTSCSTTSASRRSAATAGPSRRRTSTGSPRRALRYTQWHTTALCSPTRSCLLTGRNHTRNSMACITEAAIGFPNASGTIPPENGMLPEILGELGWNTYMVGKWHLCPTDEMNLASTRRNWPTGRGFERFYGFLGAETNQWYPDLVYDNHPVDQPRIARGGLPPDRRPHRQGARVHQGRPGRRAGEAVHALLRPGCLPRAPPRAEGVDREVQGPLRRRAMRRMREQTLARQKELGIVPQDTELPPINPIGTPQTRTGPDGKPFPIIDVTRPWETLSAEEKQLFARMAEVYAGFLAHTDDQIGRLLAFLEESEQLENTMIVVVSDNGASGEGGPNGSVNENKLINGIPDDMRGEPAPDRRARRAQRPTTTTPTAGRWRSTRRSRCGSATSSTAARATRASSPGPPASRPRARSATSTTTRSTSCRRSSTSSACEAPADDQGPRPVAASTASACATASTTATRRARARRSSTRCSAHGRSGTRAGRPSRRIPRSPGWSHFNDDEWELYHTDTDRSELHDLAAEHPEKVRELVNLWFAEAGANDALPARRPLGGRDPQHAAPAAHQAAQPLPLLPRRRRRCPRRRR